MRKTIHPVLQWLLTASFVSWSAVLLVIIVGEDNPEAQLSLFDFLVIKAMAFCSAYATYKAFVWCYEHYLFPKCIYNYIHNLEEEEEL